MGSMRYSGVGVDAVVCDLPEGRYCLGTLSTVPYVAVSVGGDTSVITWGDVVDVPKGEKASVKNASFHAGDVWLNTCTITPSRTPAQITIPARFEVLSIMGTDFYVSRWVDVRGVRRAFLGLNELAAGNLTFVVSQIAERTESYGAGTFAASQGEVVFEQEARQFLNHIPLGVGAGLYLNDAEGESLPDSRPHVLLDRVRVGVDKLLADPLGWLVAGQQIDAFFSLEYL